MYDIRYLSGLPFPKTIWKRAWEGVRQDMEMPSLLCTQGERHGYQRQAST